MATFKLHKESRGKKFAYTVTDEQGNFVSTRMSNRNYIACTIDGSYYFGRLDLINKGDHGRYVTKWRELLANPGEDYDCWVKSIGMACSREAYEKANIEKATNMLLKLTTIAYL